MKRTLTIELDADIYAVIERGAALTGSNPAEYVASRVEREWAGAMAAVAARKARAAPPATEPAAGAPGPAEQTVAEFLAERHKTRPPRPLTITRGTGEPGCFERMFGTLPGAGPIDNESIDADLAREYGSTHDDD